MSLYRNAEDVAAQLRSAGLLLETAKKTHGGTQVGPLFVESSKSVRCDISGEKKKQTGSYRLHELRLNDGIWITGAYWLGHGNAYNTIELNKECEECGADMALKDKTCPRCGSKKSKKREFSQEQLDAHKKRMAELRRQADAEAKAAADRAADWANAVWLQCKESDQPTGPGDYIGRKQLKAGYGTRVFEGFEGAFLEGAEKEDYEYLARFKGARVVPMCDVLGRRRGLQFILDREKHKEWISRRDGDDKTFWPLGMQNDGLFFLIGGAMHRVGLVAEGIATAGSLLDETGIPVAVAFTAGNLPKVGEKIWKSKKKRVNLLYCADDDWLQRCQHCKKYTPAVEPNCRHCGQPHGKGNAGITKAQEAALATSGAWLAPKFSTPRPEDRKGPNDYNDLRCIEGPGPVRIQVEEKLSALGWSSSSLGGGVLSNGGAGKKLSMLEPDDAARRFSPVWSTDDVYYFDHNERVICAKASLTGRMLRHGWDLVTGLPDWQAKPEVSMEQVDFDPSEEDPNVVYNLWNGWPEIIKPDGAKCDAILALLRHLCSHEAAVADELYDWVIKWMAYPLQHIGAKMQSAILMHGGQGAGKNTVFNNMLDIYGKKYAVEFGPKQLEKRFNALFSKKMFAIGNEIVASREELYHVKGQIKTMITERRWVVEAKNKDERWERNCCNFVFLSNELKPAAVDKGDRRHCVIWTPHVPDKGDDDRHIYDARVGEANVERKQGGAAALYEYLMSVDLTGFDEATWPPMTEAKAALIEDNLDSRERFWELWRKEEVGELPCVPCRSEDFYDGYRTWANKSGIGKHVALHSMIAFVRKQCGVRVELQRYRGHMATERRTVIMPFTTDPPPNQTREAWLGDCVEEFEVALKKFRGE